MSNFLIFRILVSVVTMTSAILPYYLHCRKEKKLLSPLVIGIGYLIGQVIVTITAITVDRIFDCGWINNVQQYSTAILTWAGIKSVLIVWGLSSYNQYKQNAIET